MAKATEKTDIILTHKFSFMKHEYTGLDVAEKALVVKTQADGVEAEKAILGSLFVGMARTCKNVDEFLSLCGAVEARKSWKSKQNPEGTVSASEAVPAWTQYKSNIKVAWADFKISPKDYDSTGKLNELLNTARKAKKEAANAAAGEQQVTESLANSAKSDMRLATIFDKFIKLFDECDSESQEIILDELAECYNGIVQGAEEAIAAEATKAKPATKETQQAVAH